LWKRQPEFLHQGHFLYGKLRPYLRKAILAPFRGICSTDIIVVRSGERILPEFLTYLVHSDGRMRNQRTVRRWS